MRSLKGTVFIRTTVFAFTGVVQKEEDGWVFLCPAMWLADTGPFTQFLRDGYQNTEREEYIDGTWINLSLVTDWTPWKHDVIPT